MLKAGIYVDSENVRLNGGFKLRYDVLKEYASAGKFYILRANSYLAENQERIESDYSYRTKIYQYHDALRRFGFKIIKKKVKKYTNEFGEVTTKANADLDLAVDAILQARNLDKIVLLTGDGDFKRLVIAIQNFGSRVEVIGFNNVSRELRETADFFISGFLIPGLIPIEHVPDKDKLDEWRRGQISNYKEDRGFGFLSYYDLTDKGLQHQEVFFHCSKLGPEIKQEGLNESKDFFEFRLAKEPSRNNNINAFDIRVFDTEY